MKTVRERALSEEVVVEALSLTIAESAKVNTLVRWLQCNKKWRRDRNNKYSEKQLGDALRATEADFPDYERRMVLMNKLLALDQERGG